MLLCLLAHEVLKEWIKRVLNAVQKQMASDLGRPTDACSSERGDCLMTKYEYSCLGPTFTYTKILKARCQGMVMWPLSTYLIHYFPCLQNRKHIIM